MGTISALAVLTKADRVLHNSDDTLKRWSQTELLGWLSDGQRDIVRRVPAANARPENVLLVSGPEQSLPSGAHRLLRPLWNTGADGATIGRAVTWTNLDDMAASDPDWVAADETDTIQQVMPSESSLGTFFCFPPADGTTYFRGIFSFLPVDITDANELIEVDDEYAGALMYYVLFAAFLKDAEESANSARAGSFFTAYMQALGIAPAQGE